MRILFAGTPEVALPCFEIIRSQVVGVITRPDAVVGRDRSTQPSSVAVASDLLPIRKCDFITLEVIDWARELRPDLGVVVAFGALLPLEMLKVPIHGWINVHFSVLPARRGAAPVQRAICEGDSESGVTIFQLDAGMDTGPIFGSIIKTLDGSEIAPKLLADLGQSATSLLTEVVVGIEQGSLHPRPQEDHEASYAPKIAKGEYLLSWDRSAMVVNRHVRGLYPHAYTKFREGRIGVIQGQPSSIERSLATGEIECTKSDVFVGTAFGTYVLHVVKPAGKREMSATEWARGARIQPGERFAWA